MKKLYTLLLIITTSYCFGQSNKTPYNFGRITQSDYDLQVYAKDSTANAVFIYERGDTTFDQTYTSIIIRTKYYGKVKIFNKEGISHATIKIPIYRNSQRSEKVTDIRGITHNGVVQTSLSKAHIYTEELSQHWSEVKFTMPNIKENSIIEYEYTLESPFKFNFKGWEFQSTIPKIYSEFHALIPGNYSYNRRLSGYYKLSKNESGIKRGCFGISGGANRADCEELTYAMKDIPAFIEEDYMTSKDNFISKIKFELSQFKGFDGSIHKFSKTWKDVDKEFKGEKSIGRQLRKVDYMKKHLPPGLFEGGNDLEKAKEVYRTIKSHFTWNRKSRVFDEVFVKKAFDEKVGNSTEINISLVNALNAVGFDAELILVSTRGHGLPTKMYPVMTDFNYVIAKLNLDDKSYLLDATDKQMPFGMIPYRTLNGYGRVMNFKKGSYWHDIRPSQATQSRTFLNLKLDKEGNLTGLINTSNGGYLGLNKRKKYNAVNEEKYLDEVEEKNIDLTVLDYKNNNLANIEKSFSEVFKIEITSNENAKTLFISPFLLEKLSENPFKLSERNYPVDFGYGYLDTYTFQLEIPENYTIKSLPKDVGFKLPNNGGMYQLSVTKKGNKVSLLSRTKLSKSNFTPEEYPYLKEFFNQIVKTNKSLITLEKNNL